MRCSFVPTLLVAFSFALAPASVSAQEKMVQVLAADVKSDLALSIWPCWNVDPGSEASKVTFAVGFTLDRDGNVIDHDVRLISSDGNRDTTPLAFQSARRAILRCMSQGYQLPEGYDQEWTDVVMTFSPVEIQIE